MTADRTANAIMQDPTFEGTYLVVEGMKDYKLYTKFLNMGNQVEIKQVGGKDKVQTVIKILNNRGFNKKVGIIDSDFSKLTKNEANVDNLFLTDYHDIEVMMFESPALETAINMYVTTEKLETFLNGIQLRVIILIIAEQIGLLKLAHHIHNLGLAFKPEKIDGNALKYKDFIDDRTLKFRGREKLIKAVCNYSFNRGNSVAEANFIEEKIDELLKNKYDLLQLVNGHDLSNIVFYLLKKVLRSQNKSLYDYNSIEDSFIMSYEARYWIKTQLFKNIYDWAELNDSNLLKEDIKDLYIKMFPEEV